MVCSTNLKSNLDKILETRSNIPDYVPPQKVNAPANEENLQTSKSTKPLFTAIPLFSENAANSDDERVKDSRSENSDTPTVLKMPSRNKRLEKTKQRNHGGSDSDFSHSDEGRFCRWILVALKLTEFFQMLLLT